MKAPRAILAAAALLGASAAVAATVTVLVQETTLRKRPQSYAPATGVARLGEKLETEGEQSGFFQTGRGWIHSSAVTTRKAKLGSGDAVGGSASADEVTLAGKGFNAQVEKSYGSQNGAADFRHVDLMERRSASESSVLDFMRSGQLLGGAQ